MRAIVIISLLMLGAVSVKAQDTTKVNFEENKHYVVLKDAKTKSPTVTEYFSLFCGHCLQFESLVPLFKKNLPEGTAFEKSHVSYLPHDNETVGEGIIRAFVAMEKLGQREELSKAFFIKIHFEKKLIEDLEGIKAIFIENGVSDADYEKAFNDPAVVAEAERMSAAWLQKGITNVPTVVVNGKYRINMGSVENLEGLNALVEHLLEK